MKENVTGNINKKQKRKHDVNRLLKKLSQRNNSDPMRKEHMLFITPAFSRRYVSDALQIENAAQSNLSA